MSKTKKVKVRIIKCSHRFWWYADKIGMVYEVIDEGGMYWCNNPQGTILKSDCEIVDTPQQSRFDIESELIEFSNSIRKHAQAPFLSETKRNYDTLIKIKYQSIVTAFKSKDIDIDALISAIMPLWTFSNMNKDEFHKQLKERIAKVLLAESPQTKIPTIKGSEGGRLNTESI